MSCNCRAMTITNEGFCYQCMPDEFSWLLPVNEKPDPFFMDRNHAYITPDNTVYVLDHTRTKAVAISGGGGGVDLSTYALKSDLESKVKDLLAEIAGLKTKVKTYKAGTNIEITGDNTINSTYDDKAVRDRLNALENMDLPVYYAGQGISIGPDKTISADITLDKVNEVVTRAVADTEINLNTSNLVVEGDNLVWKGTLNTGRQITSSVPLSALGVNQSDIDGLVRTIIRLQEELDGNIRYTAGAGINVTDDGVISLVDPIDNDTTYTAGNGLVLNGNEFAVNTTTDLVVTNGKLGIKPSYVQDNFYVDGTTLVKERADGNKVQLDFTELIDYINLGDNDSFGYTQYVQTANLYLPASTQNNTHVFNLIGYPKASTKFVYGCLVISLSAFTGKGTRIVDGVPIQHTLTKTIPTRFYIPMFMSPTHDKYFCETIRLEDLDMELVLSGYAAISTDLRLTDVKLCIVTGKAHNNVEYKYEDLIAKYPTYTRTLNGFTYEFNLTQPSRIEFFGLNITK